MTRFKPHARTAAVLAVLLCLASCGRNPAPASNPPPPVESDNGIVFVSGFLREEVLTPTAKLRWASQTAVLRVSAPGDGHYRITFLPFTVFSMGETIVKVGVNGQPAGQFSTRAFALDDVRPVSVMVTLHAGSNDLALHTDRALTRLGEDDERVAAFGLLLPVTVEPAP